MEYQSAKIAALMAGAISSAGGSSNHEENNFNVDHYNNSAHQNSNDNSGGISDNSGVDNKQESSHFRNTLNIYGNTKSMNINPMILTNIQGSPYFKRDLFDLKTFHEVVDEIYYKVDHLEPWERGSRKTSGQVGMCGGVRGVGAGGVASTAYCILFKLFTMRITRRQLNVLLNHTDSCYIRGIGFLYIRYTQAPQDLFSWYQPYLDDEEEIDPKSGGGDNMTIGDLCRRLLRKLDWYFTMFPRIPVKFAKEIDEKLKNYKLQQAAKEQPVDNSGVSYENDEGVEESYKSLHKEDRGWASGSGRTSKSNAETYDDLMAKHVKSAQTTCADRGDGSSFSSRKHSPDGKRSGHRSRSPVSHHRKRGSRHRSRSPRSVRSRSRSTSRHRHRGGKHRSRSFSRSRSPIKQKRSKHDHKSTSPKKDKKQNHEHKGEHKSKKHKSKKSSSDKHHRKSSRSRSKSKKRRSRSRSAKHEASGEKKKCRSVSNEKKSSSTSRVSKHHDRDHSSRKKDKHHSSSHRSKSKSPPQPPSLSPSSKNQHIVIPAPSSPSSSKINKLDIHCEIGEEDDNKMKDKEVSEKKSSDNADAIDNCVNGERNPGKTGTDSSDEKLGDIYTKATEGDSKKEELSSTKSQSSSQVCSDLAENQVEITPVPVSQLIEEKDQETSI